MNGPVSVGFLQDEELFLLLALIQDETLPVKSILHAWKFSHG